LLLSLSSPSIEAVARICPNQACGKRYPDDAAFCGVCGSITVEESSDARLGQRLGEYVVVARVADGAMGRVYEGRHFQTRERVAIKVLHPNVAVDAVAVERFKREFEAARDLAHPNIVRVIEFGTTPDGACFMTMEFLEGEELGKLLQRGQRMEPAHLLRVFCQLALALDHAHSFGVIHRDLKPDNIFLCRSPEGDVARILDFGSIKLQMESGPKLTAFGTTLGSPYYMSPEQAMGKADVDQRTDVFALAAIMYECVTGKIAFDAMNVAQILMKIINQPVIPASQQAAGLPPRLDDVLDRGMRKDKKSRYGTASLLLAGALDAYGLEPNVARWAATPQAQLADALAAAQPPAAAAFVDSLRPQQSVSSKPPTRSMVPAMRGNGMVIIAVGALAVVVAVTALLMR
jgi:eukaryotic-like serine/threonine-protein kinase